MKMIRQSSKPVTFDRTTRKDQSVLMSSERAGVVVPCGYIPLLRGDSASGRMGIDIDLAEMPRPLLNGVMANVQAWFVPKSAHPQFSGYDEFVASYQQEPIKALGQPDRDPPAFFNKWADISGTDYVNSRFYKALGLHFGGFYSPNTDLCDAFWVVQNFRLAAHSSRLVRYNYSTEDSDAALNLPVAFWPADQFSHVVPDYERALLLGPINVDEVAGRLQIQDYFTQPAAVRGSLSDDDGTFLGNGSVSAFFVDVSDEDDKPSVQLHDGAVTLADVDKARVSQGFAKLRASYAGNDSTGFDNDDAIVADLMQGFAVPEEHFKRPWLLDSAMVPFGMSERHATDGASLNDSVTKGRCSASLSINVPQTDTGGIIIFTVEVLPERFRERAVDNWAIAAGPWSLPNALRDLQRPEPVDQVFNFHIDADHNNAFSIFGYEPMNQAYNRNFTRLGGDFYHPDAAVPPSETRSAVWDAGEVNPVLGNFHYLCPPNFSHDVFSDTNADAFEFVVRHDVTIRGITQIGDPLAEGNDDYDAVREGAGT